MPSSQFIWAELDPIVLSTQPINSTDLQRAWELVILPAILAEDPTEEECADWSYSYISGGIEITVEGQICPAPITETDLDRAWDNVIKPAIEAKFAQHPPD